MHKYSWLIFILPITAFILSSCGGSSSSSSTATYTVGGTVTGENSAITLLNDSGDGADNLSAAGSFSFSDSVGSSNCYTAGCPYSLSMYTQPVGQVCSISNAQGIIGNSNVADINITCTTSPQTVAYSFSGLSDGGQPNSGLSEGTDRNFYGVTTYGGTYDLGTFYRYDRTTRQVNTLYSFGGVANDGIKPDSGLTQACDGNWYGVTLEGGINGAGTFYKITSTGSETVLYSFGASTSDASKPQGIVENITSCPNPAPIFYGTSSSGGTKGLGTIYSMSLTGAITVLYSFGTAPGDGNYPMAGMARGSDGKYYGTTFYGGANDSGTFFQFNPATGSLNTLHSFGGTTADGQNPDHKPVEGADGNFYGSTPGGGVNGFGIIYKIVPSSGAETVFYTFKGGTTDGQQPSGRLKIGVDRNFYGVTYYGGTFNNGTFYRITPTGTQTLLYSFAGPLSSDGLAPNSSLLQTSDGTWWGTTVSGGVNQSSQGTIFSIVAP